VVHLDGDELRKITGNTDLSPEGRVRNVQLAQGLCLKLQAEGIVAIASFVSPHRAVRDVLKAHPGVLEVYVHTTALRGKEGYFVRDYEPPVDGFLDLDTTGISVEACVDRILAVGPAR
jgi:adenylylsulfate kinase-like enzyme